MERYGSVPSNHESRPNGRERSPDAFLSMIRRAQRGKLKVYLGYCAGVGKTYQMLLEGRRLKEGGIDVVVGYVETHGRAETAELVEGLEVIPRTRQEYRGVPLEEMDTAALVARRPAVVLIDELAHTNVPGSRNQKRYEDVQDILAAGIHVITTLNVQHLESLYNTVEGALRVKVRERLPDSVLAQADQIVNVDLTTEDLRRRLQEGKIYPKERIEAALSNFFVPSNLEQLREIALRELASQIDSRRREPVEEEPYSTPDQVMVCLSSRGPNSGMLLRYASRLAGRLNRNWYALYVQTPSEDPAEIDARTQRLLSGSLTLAKQLGAMVFTYKGADIAETIIRFAREYRVGHIVLGTPANLSFWQRVRGRRTIVDRLIQEGKNITVVVLDTRQMTAEEDRAETEYVPATGPAPLSLCELLLPSRIVIWEEPVPRDEVLAKLVDAAAADDLLGDIRDDILRRTLLREEQGSTFMNEGVALPHARLEYLTEPRVALGLTRMGISDVATQEPIECVFLMLFPMDNPGIGIKVLALAATLAKDRQSLKTFRSANRGEEVALAIKEWETERMANRQQPC